MKGTLGRQTVAARQIRDRERGLSLIELTVIVTMVLIILGIGIPQFQTMMQNDRIAGDTRGIAAQLALGRIRAASAGAKTRVNFNLTANTYQIEVWNPNASPAAYQVEGGVQYLSEGDSFGYGSISTAAGQQSTIGQTSPIYFNSRGLATDNSGNATSTSAIYITNGQGLYSAVAVSIAGQPAAYRYSGSAWVAE